MALLNLAVNARDAMPDGGQIILAAREENSQSNKQDGLRAGRYVLLTLTDSGEGMDAATLQRAMEPFFTTKEPGKGTGLGLPMVHGLAEQSGGLFKLKSCPGEGTTAQLWLPVAEQAVTAIEPSRSVPAVEEKQRALFVVLAVDDDNLVLTNTVAMLEDLGHTVIAAKSAHAALAALRRSNSIDLVITDHIMPQMTGLQLAQAIKREWPTLPVILATGFAELAPQAEPIARLSKPFTQADLNRALAAL
jgi:CheY-like chemotaxis protein